MTAFPVVERDDASRAFFDAASAGQLLIQACAECGAAGGVEAKSCLSCGGADLQGVPASGDATLVSWTVVHHAPVPVLADAVPYASAVVELAEGPWVIGRLVDVTPVAGMAVQVQFVPVEGGETLPVFGAAP